MTDYTAKPNDDSRFPWGWVAIGGLALLAATGAVPNLKSALGDGFDWVIADKGMGPLIWATDCLTVWFGQSFSVPQEHPGLLGQWAGMWAVNITLTVLFVRRVRAKRAAKKEPAALLSHTGRRRGSLSPAQMSLAEQEALVAELASLALERARNASA